YSSLSTLLGANVVKYNLTATNHWQPDFEELERLVTPRTRILWSNYPHMPTGAKAQRETYERLVQFAKRHSLVVVNDNPYSFILNHDRLSILQIEGAKDCCIELNSMSKSHNMPGWRVGMLMTNATLISWILKVKSNIDSGTLRPLQLAAAKALQNDAQWHERANITTYAKRRAIAEQIMDTLGCTYDKDSVGMFLWGRIPKKYDNAETLTERVLHEADVFITPGFIFGNNGERYIRISLCAKDERMQQALERIKKMTI
ncbi:MAG: aminotransferase class I/II-fold pyridoxal phosphate-dependent enzyme, partial [Bacteroidaceae bacterium]|nr:aminotransferase class I/II-fold pyridoxal phosphate-dependent enzyme [Bacteroidaceae bacterium]